MGFKCKIFSGNVAIFSWDTRLKSLELSGTRTGTDECAAVTISLLFLNHLCLEVVRDVERTSNYFLSLNKKKYCYRKFYFLF
jgi:hypothetical protein